MKLRGPLFFVFFCLFNAQGAEKLNSRKELLEKYGGTPKKDSAKTKTPVPAPKVNFTQQQMKLLRTLVKSKMLNKERTAKSVNVDKKNNLEMYVRVMLMQFRNIPIAKIEKVLLEKSGSSPVGIVIQRNKKALRFVALLLKDANALPKVAHIVDNRKKLSLYVMINIGIFIFGWILRKALLANKSFWRSMQTSLFLVVIFVPLRITVLVLFFYQDFRPLALLFKKVFL